MIKFNPISLGGWGLLLLCMGLDLKFGCFNNGYIVLSAIVLCAMLILIPQIVDLRREARNSHETRNDIEPKC